MPLAGATSRSKVAGCPGDTDCAAVLAFIVKADVVVNSAKKKWDVASLSVPTAAILKLYAAIALLLAVTVKAVPVTVGVTLGGEATHAGGAFEPQERFTGLL